MHSPVITPFVLMASAVSVMICVVSVYISRIYLPRKIHTAYLNSITVLAAAVEARDAGTLGHASRVSDMTVELAARLGLEGEDLERIEYAALLMDMGKANVPQSILTKVDPLTDEEWSIVKTHPVLGANIASSVAFLADLREYILYHHEYWDGSGYPVGLIGDEIPLVSRILSVAADYDALISPRPYRLEAMSIKEAIEEIREGLGIKYDPRVGDEFITMTTEQAESEEPALITA